MANLAPNAAHHHTELGIKGEELEKTKLACPLIGIRQTGFEDGNEIETETDEGHTGVSNLDMGSFRKSAESSPNWEDGCRYGQGFEDYMYLLLGTDTIDDTDSSRSIYVHTFTMPPNTEKDLPLATIYHGFQKTNTDARIFNNAMMNEFEFTMSADDLPKAKPTFISDYNIVNVINPTRHLLDDHLARTVMAAHTSVYIGPLTATEMWDGTGDSEGKMIPIDCFTEASFTVNQNAESQSCHGDDFGVNTKTMGARETTGSITMPWVDGTKYFETEYECYNKYGHIVSTEITQKQIWYVCEGGSIKRESDSDTLETGETIIDTIVTGAGTESETTTYIIDTGVPFKTIFKFPVAEATNVTSTKSGNEAKELTFEWKCIEQPTQSYMTVIMTTDLAECHIDTTGTTRSAFYPNTTTYPEFAGTASQ